MLNIARAVAASLVLGACAQVPAAAQTPECVTAPKLAGNLTEKAIEIYAYLDEQDTARWWTMHGRSFEPHSVLVFSRDGEYVVAVFVGGCYSSHSQVPPEIARSLGSFAGGVQH